MATPPRSPPRPAARGPHRPGRTSAESRLDSPRAHRKLCPFHFTNTMSQQLRPVVKRARRKAYLKRKKAAAKKQQRSSKK